MRPPTMTAHGAAVPDICAAKVRAITAGADSAGATTTAAAMTGVAMTGAAMNRVTMAGAAAAAIAVRAWAAGGAWSMANAAWDTAWAVTAAMVIGGRHGMGRGHDRGYGMDRDGRGPRYGMDGGRGRMSAADPAELDSVKKEIGVTAAQEQAWTKYAAAIKEAADARKARREGIDHDAMRKLSPEDHRKFRDSMWEQRRKEQDAVRTAVDELVKSLRRKADRNRA